MSTLKVKGISAPTGYDLQMPAGAIIQVVSADIGALLTTTSTSFVDTNASLAITPKFASSKIICNFNFILAMWGQSRVRAGYQLVRGSTVISGGAGEVIQIRDVSGSSQEVTLPVSLNKIDSPSTTSATTYKIQIKATEAGGSVQLIGQNNTRPGHMILMEVAQ